MLCSLGYSGLDSRYSRLIAKRIYYSAEPCESRSGEPSQTFEHSVIGTFGVPLGSRDLLSAVEYRIEVVVEKTECRV